MIRTQPYDLLRWSAAYFRSIASQLEPPVKLRLEQDETSSVGQLTKGYLKALLNLVKNEMCYSRMVDISVFCQVGKGYFINRDILQKQWMNLCLSENELLKFLSLCRMLHWERVHWLKLFAVLVGSLNQVRLWRNF